MDLPEDIEAMDVLTLTEAATLLRVHRMTLYPLARSGRIPCRKVGGQWRFLRSELLDWLANPLQK